MRINGVTYGKLKTPLKVNGNLNYDNAWCFVRNPIVDSNLINSIDM